MNCAVHNQTQAVAYCRTCGKALCEDCKRDVMGAIYCEPCIAARLQGAAQASPGVAAPPRPVVPVAPGGPSPMVAGLLGFIPGVGAMYNGQFVKAFAHVLIFVLLIIATTKIGYFGMLIAFFVFYMAFEAYKTAEARRLGLPAPDPLGLDRMFGLQESQPPVVPGMAPVNPQSVQPPVQIEPPQPTRDSSPVGAVVLIGLGILFLLGGRFHMERLWPLFLIGIGLWVGFRRSQRQTCPCVRCRTRGLMGSAVLITIGVLFFLNENSRYGLEDTWPAFLLVVGAVLLISRTGSIEGHVEQSRYMPAAVPQAANPQPWSPAGSVPPGDNPQPWSPGVSAPPQPPVEPTDQVKP